MKVSDLMIEDVKTVQPQTDLLTVYDLMDKHRFRHVPVLDDEGQLVGLVTHRDLVRGALAGLGETPMTSQRAHLALRDVRSVMVPDPETVEPELALLDAAEIMLENKFGCLLVANGLRLEGILTEADFVRYVAREQGAA